MSGAEPDKCFSAFLVGVAADNHVHEDFSLDGGAADDGFGGGGQFFDRLAAHFTGCPVLALPKNRGARTQGPQEKSKVLFKKGVRTLAPFRLRNSQRWKNSCPKA